MFNSIDIYQWNNSDFELHETINIKYQLYEGDMFSINQELFAVTNYGEEFDYTNPDKPLAAGIYVYKKEEKAKINIKDIICALQILSGQQCHYQGEDVLSDNIVGLKDIIYSLHKIAY